MDDDLPGPERGGQGDADNGEPTRIVLNDQRAVAVDVDIGHGCAVHVELEDFDSARHRILARQGVRESEQGACANQQRAQAHQGMCNRGTAKRGMANQGPSTLARILPTARRTSIGVPGLNSAALRTMAPPTRLTMA